MFNIEVFTKSAEYHARERNAGVESLESKIKKYGYLSGFEMAANDLARIATGDIFASALKEIVDNPAAAWPSNGSKHDAFAEKMRRRVTKTLIGEWNPVAQNSTDACRNANGAAWYSAYVVLLREIDAAFGEEGRSA